MRRRSSQAADKAGNHTDEEEEARLVAKRRPGVSRAPARGRGGRSGRCGRGKGAAAPVSPEGIVTSIMAKAAGASIEAPREEEGREEEEKEEEEEEEEVEEGKGDDEEEAGEEGEVEQGRRVFTS